MARRKKTPETSKIARVSTVAYARKQKSPADGEAGTEDGEAAEAEGAETPAAGEAPGAAAGPEGAGAGAGLDAKFDVTDRSQPMPMLAEARAQKRARTDGGAPAEPPPAEPPDRPARRESGRDLPTATMPVVAPVGRPPEMPAEPPPAGLSPRADAVEDPTNMPHPRQIPPGSPGDPAAAPGLVPRGDSRSLRRRDATTYEFALIYRRDTFVITRFGVVGMRGQWRVVEYPTSTAASHAYAKECSRFVSEGFSDYRE